MGWANRIPKQLGSTVGPEANRPPGPHIEGTGDNRHRVEPTVTASCELAPVVRNQEAAPAVVAAHPSVISLCDYMEGGRTYRASCKLLGVSTGEMWRRINATADGKDRYSRARAMAGRIAADEVLEIADAATPETVQVARLRAEKRQWYAAKMNPAEFGERTGTVVNVGHGAGANITVTDETLKLLQERRRIALEGMRPASAEVVNESAPDPQ